MSCRWPAWTSTQPSAAQWRVSPEQQVQERVRLLELERQEIECCSLDGSFFTQKGVILQFINNNCAGATSLIGGLRLALTDIRKDPGLPG
jgi:hypothetical protein